MTIREITETAYVIVRTHSVKAIDDTLRMAADEVIHEEFETSIENFTKVLTRYLVPFVEIHTFITQIKAHKYELLSQADKSTQLPAHLQLHIPDRVIASLPSHQEDNRIAGKTILESAMKSQFNLTVLEIRRQRKSLRKSVQKCASKPMICSICFAPAKILRD